MGVDAGLDPTALPPATLQHTVGPADTAETLGSGDLAVLGTPKVLALGEAACLAVLDGRLAAELSTVGTDVGLQHLAPTPVGSQVSVTATLSAVEGRSLDFDVEVRDGTGTLLATARLRRVIVNRQRFMGRLAGPAG